jgi:DNA-binding response OmpR family regulator
MISTLSGAESVVGNEVKGESLVRVLIVEDEKKVASFIAKGLQEEGHAVDVQHDGENGAIQALRVDYDLVVLDLMLPKRSGLEVLRAIRIEKTRLPVLILTAKGELEDRVSGLDAGADDYLVKPFAFAELSARVRALLRRGTGEDTRIRVADLEIDTATRIVKREGRQIDLKPKEYALLEFLMRYARRPITRTMITEHVWDIHFDSISNVVDVHINSLRNKIDKGFSSPLIHTVRGVGYMLSDKEL